MTEKKSGKQPTGDAAPGTARLQSDANDAARLLRATLSSIGDGVITTDAHGKVTMLNPVAQDLTGWTQEAAVGRPLTEVFRIVNQETRAEVENPALRCLKEGVIVGLANHTILIAKDGAERNIDDSAAPIENEKGEVAGAVLVFRDITERYRAEKLIADGRAYAENILRTLRHGFLVLDKDLRVVSANRAFYKRFQVEPAQTEGRPVYELGNGQWGIPALREALEQILPRNGHTIEDFEVGHDFETIGPRVMLLNARRVNKPGNHSELILLVIEDVTEQRRADAALREAEKRYRTLFDAMDEGYCIIEVLFDAQQPPRPVDYRFIQVNGSFERQAGMQDVVGKRMLEFVPFIEPHWLHNYGKVALTGEGIRFSGEYTGLHKHFDVYAFRDAGWPEHHVAVLFADVTRRKQAERTLADSEMRYRRLFQAAKDGILILDAHTGRITDANAFMGGLAGIEAHELLGKELHEIGLFADAQESKRMVRELQENKYVRYEHLPVQRQGGGTVEVEVVGNIYHEDHTLVAQCNVRDISQRVVMEQKIKEQTEALASESRRKDEFLAMLSHELRNPLAPIRSAVHLLRTQERGSENLLQTQAHDIIERQVANLTKLVSDLLEVSRVVSGKIRLSQQVVDLNQVVGHAVETVTPLVELHRHGLALHLCPEEVWVNADPTRLEEVFINLLNNAAKYTPEGGGIEVWCERPRGSNHARFRVRDNGVGIDKDLLPRVFDLFTQADRSLARSAGGLGIGLSLAHRLVEMHGGSIEAHSPPEGETAGSEFVVSLPLAAPPPRSEAAEPEAPAARPEGVRVLLVDDNIDLMMMLASLLRQEGYSVQAAYTGPDGLKVARQWRPDVVLLDIGLPGLDGYEVARRLRADARQGGGGGAGKAMRIIALTGYGRDADLALAREAGFDGHLTKPVEFKELARMLAAPAVPDR